jgi:hypothetical protein
MVDDGFLIGFEDSSGNFVEVGRFNNTADDVTQPLEIKHQNSGERITLDSSGLKAQKIDDDRLYAGAFPGADADARLSNAINAVSTGETIYLENADYTADITVNTRVKLVGSGASGSRGTRVSGTTTWTFDNDVELISLALPSNDVTIKLNANHGRFRSFYAFPGSEIIVDGSDSIISEGRDGEVTLSSNSSECVVDNCSGTSVTDNGSSNIIGDIA